MLPLFIAAMLGVAASAGEAVNIPYPLSPDEAARNFLHLIDRLQPEPWSAGEPSGLGPFLVAGTLQAKTLAPDGSAVLMLKLPDGQCILVKSPSSLPEIAISQRLYAVVDFKGQDGSAAARLLGIALACDLRGRRAAVDAMLGIKPAEPVRQSQPAASSSPPRSSAPPPTQSQPQGPQAAQPSQPVQRSWTAGLPPRWVASGGLTSAYAGWPGAVGPGAAGSQMPQTTAAPQTGATAQPGTFAQPPESPQERYRVEYWTAYVLRRNPKLSRQQAEAIVRWVLYYSAYYGVDHRLIFAVMRYESDFDPGCVSHAGAIGLMQLMPETARELGVNPWVVEDNIRGGIAELAGYLDTYADRSNYEQTILALASYNAGPNAVKRAGGVPQITETINYVRRVSDLFYQFVKNGAP